jgi:CubicO group peptidase (beta-lactamase class C family)
MIGRDGFESRVPSLMDFAAVPGLSLAIVRGGEIALIAAFGCRNADTQEPVNPRTVFEAASLSKPVVAYAVLQLVDAGELELDEPLCRFAPIVPDDPVSLRITARHVLSHTTGLPNWRRDEYPLRTYFPPGARFSYSGEGFVYLQSVIERLTGETLHLVVKRLVFDPLKMRDSSFLWQKRFDGKHAAPHDSAGPMRDKFKPKLANAAYSLHTTAADYARFVVSTLSGSRLNETTAALWLTPQVFVPKGCFEALDIDDPEAEPGVAWGLGWGLEPETGTFFHWGSNPGATAFVLGAPADRSAFVAFMNSDAGLKIVPDIAAEIIPSRHPSFGWLSLA